MNADSDVIKLPHRILGELGKSVIGKDEVKRIIILALIAGGHVLIEGLPGTAKTKLASSIARITGCEFKRIQFTPDMMPADITGFFLYSPNNEPRFITGPIFTNLVLADELNRTTPRTQSALLEAMQEHQVTIEKRTHDLPKPFMVIATQVESGSEGTYPLTDVQVDRFMLRACTRHASIAEEKLIVTNIDQLDEPNICAVANSANIIKLQQRVKEVYVAEGIIEYIVSIVDKLRQDPDVLLSPSSRASIALFKCARALAMLELRDFVIPDDVKQLVGPAIEHRIKIKPEAEMDGILAKDIIERAIEQIPVPKMEALWVQAA